MTLKAHHYFLADMILLDGYLLMLSGVLRELFDGPSRAVGALNVLSSMIEEKWHARIDDKVVSMATSFVARADHGTPLWTLLTAMQSGYVNTEDLRWVAHKVRCQIEGDSR